MNKRETTFSTETVISFILRWGVFISAIIIFFGVVLMLIKHNSLSTGWNLKALLFYSPAMLPHRFFPLDISSILSQAAALHPFAIIELGLLFLIAIPVLRVATSIFLFAIEKDRLYVVITTIVLAVLLISLLKIR
jgi:uncharacterized membrane protein